MVSKFMVLGHLFVCLLSHKYAFFCVCLVVVWLRSPGKWGWRQEGRFGLELRHKPRKVAVGPKKYDYTYKPLKRHFRNGDAGSVIATARSMVWCTIQPRPVWCLGCPAVRLSGCPLVQWSSPSVQLSTSSRRHFCLVKRLALLPLGCSVVYDRIKITLNNTQCQNGHTEKKY